MTIKLIRRRNSGLIFGFGSIIEIAPETSNAYGFLVRNVKQRHRLTLEKIGSSLHRSMENFVDEQKEKEKSFTSSGKAVRYPATKHATR